MSLNHKYKSEIIDSSIKKQNMLPIQPNNSKIFPTYFRMGQ